jgi:LPXTG-site transpeptidase (sortase) family protein
MNKKPFVILLVSFLLMGGLLLTQGTSVAFSRPLLGITMTPTDVEIEQPTSVPATAVPTPARTPSPTDSEESEPVLPTTGEAQISIASVCYSFEANSPVKFVNFPALQAYVPVDSQDSSAVRGAVTRIVIPSLSVDAKVDTAEFSGSSWSVSDLGRKVGWLQNTSLPENGGNTVLAGHVSLISGASGPFYNLAYLKPGAKVYIYTDDNKMFVYKMRERIVVQPSDLSVTEKTSASQLTMLTCSNWDQDRKEYTKRVAIIADLDSFKELGSK